jgi:pimeloyl-ACP methyl ester carboxylesterase
MHTMTHLSSRISIGEPNQPASSTHNARTYIIYYITGNPGLIEYYRTFLVHLYGLLQHKYLNAGASGRHVDFEIHGRSLAGFEVDASGSHKKGGVTGPPYNVNQQIEFTIQDIKDTVKAVRAKRTGGDVRLILMGHSLGTYLSLEVMRLLREEAAEAGVHDDTGCVRVVGAVLLFATIMNLAKSPSGVKTSVCMNRDLLVKGHRCTYVELTKNYSGCLVCRILHGVRRCSPGV